MKTRFCSSIVELALKNTENTLSIHCPFMKTVRKESLNLVDYDGVAQNYLGKRAEWPNKTVYSTQSLSKFKPDAFVLLDTLKKSAASFCKAYVPLVISRCSTTKEVM